MGHLRQHAHAAPFVLDLRTPCTHRVEQQPTGRVRAVRGTAPHTPHIGSCTQADIEELSAHTTLGGGGSFLSFDDLPRDEQESLVDSLLFVGSSPSSLISDAAGGLAVSVMGMASLRFETLCSPSTSSTTSTTDADMAPNATTA